MTVTPLETFPPEELGERGRFLRRAVPLVFFGVSLILLLAGIGAFVAAFLRSRDLPDGFAWKTPIEQVSNRALAPSSALLPLTDLPAEDALDRTLEASDFESAFALVAYDPRLSDPSRVGALLQLGAQFSAAKNLKRAAWSYAIAATLATISPALSDSARIETLLTAGAGLRSVYAREASRRAMDQAFLIALYSPALRKQTRASRLNQVANAYDSLGLAGLADQARSKAQDAASAADSPATNARAPFIPVPGKLPASSSIEQLTQRRILAATQLLDDVTAVTPKTPADWPQDSLDQLKEALVDEDAARADYYDQQLPLAKDPAVQIALQSDKLDWLALKYRVARGAFGANIAPEWTKQANDIADDLSDAWSDLFRIYQTQAKALANPQGVNQATEDVLKQQLIAVRWGWSQTLETDLRASISDLTIKLRDGLVPTLRLDQVTKSGKTMYLLVPDELYGQGAQMLPQ